MTPAFTRHRETLDALHKAAGGNLNSATDAARLAAVKAVWGDGATDDTYRQFLAEWSALWADGCRLAELVVTYGFFPGRGPGAWDTAALALAQPFAEQLVVRREAEARRVAEGGVGSVAFYSTYTAGDLVAAKRLYAEALARRALR